MGPAFMAPVSKRKMAHTSATAICAIWRLLTGAMNAGPMTVASCKGLSSHTIISTEYKWSTKLHTT